MKKNQSPEFYATDIHIPFYRLEIWMRDLILPIVLMLISAGWVNAQCPSGWQSYETYGHAVGYKAVNKGGDAIDPFYSLGDFQLDDAEFGLFRPDNAAIVDNIDTLTLYMGDLVTAGSTMTMSLGYFSNSSSRMKILYSADGNTWTNLGDYSRTNGSGVVFYSTLGSRVADHFDFSVPSGGLRYLRFIGTTGSCYVEGVRFRSVCRPTNCTTKLTPAASVVSAQTTNVTRADSCLSFSYTYPQQLYTTTTIQQQSATMQANGNSQLTVDLGTLVDDTKQIIISYTGWGANARSLWVYSSTDGVNFTFLQSIGNSKSSNSLQCIREYYNGTYADAEIYEYFGIAIPSGGARYVRVIENGAGGGQQAYIDGIGYGCGLFDFGDAPDVSAGNGSENYSSSLENKGPAHIRTAPEYYSDPSFKSVLYLNESPNYEFDAQPSKKANADKFETISLPPLTASSSSYSVQSNSIKGTNLTGTAANVYAWIDFNENGSFEVNEYASSTLPVGTNVALSSNLSWPNLPEISGKYYFMRIRVTTSQLTDDAGTTGIDERSIGLAGNGEVEDYRIGVTNFFITGMSVGECKNDKESGNVPKVLVAVMLDWSDIANGDKIAVTLGNETKYVEASVAGTPKYAQFIVDPTGATLNASAYLLSNPSVIRSGSAVLPPPCPLPVCEGPQSIGGQAFIDYNASGAVEGAEPGITDIPVYIIDDNGTLLCKTTTGVNGIWSCNGLPAGTKVRIEYVVPDGFFNSPPGQGVLTSTQFGEVGGGCNYNLGVYKPEDFVDNNPWVVTTCFGKGDPLLPGSDAGKDPSIVANRFLTNGGVGNKNYYLAKGSETGTVWGVAYQPETKTVISSAFIRRHVGLGPAGLGGIYKTSAAPLIAATNPSAGSTYYGGTSVLLNLDDYGIDTGNESDIDRSDLGTSASVPSRDAAAFAKVGKWGLGDIDISARYDTLWAINLKNRSLVQMIIGNPILSPVPAGNVTEIAIPEPGCIEASDWRPFGLKYRNGRLYIGGVCSGESSKNLNDMYAIVYEYYKGNWNQVISIPLNYKKGYTDVSVKEESSKWRPWTDNFDELLKRGPYWVMGPCPMLSDIEFDPSGNMLLSFGDRAGYQLGAGDYSTNPTDTKLRGGIAGGDILYLYNNNGTFLLENNATVGYKTSASQNNGQGPGGAEYFSGDKNPGFTYHAETILGGSAVHPITGDVLSTMIDATTVFTNGWKRFNLASGIDASRYDIFGGFGKSAGLGDLELLAGSGLPDGLGIEVGNYVWFDTDEDGIQDPSELPVSGLKVSLYKKDGAFIGETTTDAKGNYLFSNLEPRMDYAIVFGNLAQYENMAMLFQNKKWTVTAADVNTGLGNDENDSDGVKLPDTLAAPLKNVLGICFTTGEIGENNYTYDLGLIPFSPVSIGDTVWVDVNKDGIQDAGEPGVAGVPVVLHLKNGTPVDTVYTDANGKYLFKGLQPTTDYIIQFGFMSNYNGASLEFSGVTYTVTSANQGSDDAVDSDGQTGVSGIPVSFSDKYVICLTTGNIGENNYTYDLGLFTTGIGNMVWKDLNFNGVMDPTEQGVAGVVVKVHPCSGNVPGNANPNFTKVTDAYGKYLVQDLPAGSYALSFNYSGVSNAAELRFAMPNVETNSLDDIDSDVLRPGNLLNKDVEAFTGCFSWDPNIKDFDPTFDAGLICDDLLIDPTGYIYCEHSGEILEGGLITVSGPGNVYMIHDGSSGYYQFFVDKVGTYTIDLTNPPSYSSSINCLPKPGVLDAPDSLQIYNPYKVGAGDDNQDGYLDNYTCTKNRLYTQMLLEPGDYIANNNFPMSCLDLGDLPNNYASQLSENGPKHPVAQTPNLYMGLIVDIEADAATSTMAGIMGLDGDDLAGPAADDEDGLQYIPTFLPGFKTDIYVQVTNNVGRTAYLKAFADFNGDGDFLDPMESVEKAVNNGYGGLVKLTFMPPANAVTGQKLGLRLRLSTSQGSSATGMAPNGEVEDYMFTIPNTIFVGNYVWIDANQNGLQDAGETPVAGVPVSLYSKAGTLLDTTSTNLGGEYYFYDLTPSTDYIVVFGDDSQYNGATLTIDGKNYMATTADATSNSKDSLDSDAKLNVSGIPVALQDQLAICFKSPATGFDVTNDLGLVVKGIGNLVWKDSNFNGSYDAGEEGVLGVKVNVHPCTNGVPGDALSQYMQTTDFRGNYLIQNLPAGSYALSFDYSMVYNQDTLRFTLPNINNNGKDSIDSDVKIPFDLYGMDQPLTVSTTMCFDWTNASSASDMTHDAGLMCEDQLIDPTGWIYCELTGEILQGGQIQVTGPGNVYIIHDGSSGYYQFFVDAVGTYDIDIKDPSGYSRSLICLEKGLLDAPDSLMLNNPYSVGSEDGDSDGYLDVYTCGENRLYQSILLEPGDFIINNNFPYACADMGDLPANYATVLEDNGAKHAIPQVPNLFIGNIVDKDSDGQPEAMAGMMDGGDDGTGPAADDEDGLILPVIMSSGEMAMVPVNVTNNTNSTAKLYGFVDFNNDGNFTHPDTVYNVDTEYYFDVIDSLEMEMVEVPAGYSGEVQLKFNVPSDAASGVKIGFRLRLSTLIDLLDTGCAPDGEVEDYMIIVGGFDYGDLPETYNTAGTDSPPRHSITEDLKLGVSVDSETDGQAESMAGLMTGGDDGNSGTQTYGTPAREGDDEDGIELISPIIAGQTACVSYDAMNNTGETAVLQGWIDFDNNGTFEADEQLNTGSFAAGGGVTVDTGMVTDKKLSFTVPTDINYGSGYFFARFRLSPDGGLAPDSQIGDDPDGEIEDYKFVLAKVGNLVWEDVNNNGLQDSGETGIDSVMVSLTWAGPDGDVQTTGDNVTYMTKTGPQGGFQTGEYNFCGLVPGNYKLTFIAPEDMVATKMNAGSQVLGGVLDSDAGAGGASMNVLMPMEVFTLGCAPCQPLNEGGAGDDSPAAVGGFPDSQTDETHDMGFWRPCCSDLLNYCCPQNKK